MKKAKKPTRAEVEEAHKNLMQSYFKLRTAYMTDLREMLMFIRDSFVEGFMYDAEEGEGAFDAYDKCETNLRVRRYFANKGGEPAEEENDPVL
jgi:hypothetical protein